MPRQIDSRAHNGDIICMSADEPLELEAHGLETAGVGLGPGAGLSAIGLGEGLGGRRARGGGQPLPPVVGRSSNPSPWYI